MSLSTHHLSDSIRGFAEQGGSDSAIITVDGVRPWSYVALAIGELQSATAGSEPGEGLSIGVITRNRSPHLALIAATIALGHCYLTFNPMFSDQDLASDIERVGLHVIAGSRGDLDRPGVREAALRSGAAVIELTDGEEPLAILRESGLNRDVPDRSDIAIAMLSSGTTGVPKRITLTYDNLAAAIGQLVVTKPVSRSTPTAQLRPALVWHPVGHISGAVMSIEAFSVGRPVILMERFDPTLWASLVEQYEVRLGQVNPTAMRMILDANIEPSQLRSLRYVRGGTTATPPELQEEFESRFNIPFMTTYGATEFAGAVASWSPEDYRLHGKTHVGSSGRPHPGVQMRTVDPSTHTSSPRARREFLKCWRHRRRAGTDTGFAPLTWPSSTTKDSCGSRAAWTTQSSAAASRFIHPKLSEPLKNIPPCSMLRSLDLRTHDSEPCQSPQWSYVRTPSSRR